MTVSLHLPEDIALMALEASSEEDCTVAELLRRLLKAHAGQKVRSPSSTRQDRQSFLDAAVERAKALKPGAKFTLESLMQREWDLIPSRRAFGLEFKRRVETEGIALHTGRDNTANMASYTRS